MHLQQSSLSRTHKIHTQCDHRNRVNQHCCLLVSLVIKIIVIIIIMIRGDFVRNASMKWWWQFCWQNARRVLYQRKLQIVWKWQSTNPAQRIRQPIWRANRSENRIFQKAYHVTFKQTLTSFNSLERIFNLNNVQSVDFIIRICS